MESLYQLTVTEFLAKTAGNDPVPGGGSVSALAGALAAALGHMVANLTAGRKKYAEYDQEMRALMPLLHQEQEALTKFIDEDSKAYDVVFQAFKLPKETEIEKAERKGAIQAATLVAAQVPLQVAREAAKVLEQLTILAVHGNQNAITDVCVAAMMANTAVRGAVYNVRINLTGLDDRQKADELSAECDALTKLAAELEAEILGGVNL